MKKKLLIILPVLLAVIALTIVLKIVFPGNNKDSAAPVIPDEEILTPEDNDAPVEPDELPTELINILNNPELQRG